MTIVVNPSNLVDPSLRVVYSNAIDRKNTLTASSEADPTLAAANLLTNIKSEIYRGVGTSVTLTATWFDLEPIGVVCLPFTNMTQNATMRVRGYINTGDSTPLFDTGALSCCRFVSAEVWGWEDLPAGVNAYAYGGGTYAVVWFMPASVRKLVVDLADAGNVSGYIEAARLVAGNYWSPLRGVDYGASLSWLDNSKHSRNEAGDLMTERSTRYRKITMSTNSMPPEDRSRLMQIVRSNGLPRPLLVSLYPENPDAQLEWDHMIFGKLSTLGGITAPSFEAYNSQIDIEEI